MLTLYGMRCYDGVELTENYIPCENPDGVKGAWDTVSGRFLDRDALLALIVERLMNADSITIW